MKLFHYSAKAGVMKMPFFKQEFDSGESKKTIIQISSTERLQAVPKQVNFKYCV